MLGANLKNCNVISVTDTNRNKFFVIEEEGYLVCRM